MEKSINGAKRTKNTTDSREGEGEEANTSADPPPSTGVTSSTPSLPFPDRPSSPPIGGDDATR